MLPSQENRPDTDVDATLHGEELDATLIDCQIEKRHADSDRLWASCSELAARYGVNAEHLRQRLARLMREDDSAYREVENRGPKDPRYLFQIAKVRPIIESMKGPV